jgi:hypothetical protein
MTIATGLAVYKTAPLVLVGESMEGAVCERSLTQTSSKFSLRIWLDKQTLSDHRNSVKLQTLSFSKGEPHPAAMRPWRRVEPM